MSVVRKLKKAIKKRLQIKTPVYVPVLYGELLKGRRALVTGGTRGIGFAIANAFLRNGALVVITGRSQETINRACKELKERNPNAEVYGYVLDNMNIVHMEEVLLRILKERDINILVNNAGVINKTGFVEASEADYDSVMDTNLKGTYFLSKAFALYMVDNGIKGNILNVLSSSALRPTTTSYGLTKWGLRGFTLGLAKELSKHDIVVNGIAPGPTYTKMLADDGETNLMRMASPSGRLTDVEEIGNIATVLVSDMGRMINGDTVYISGGCGNLTLDDWG